MERVHSIFVVLAVTFGVAGCAGAALRAAERGDRATLNAEIQAKHARGTLSNGEAASLGRAVAAHELAVARDETSALARLREVRGCTRELESVLENRASGRDGAAAEAMLVLFEDRLLSERDVRPFLEDPDARFRGIAARTLHRDEDGDRRRQGIVDPSPNVRRGAIRASAEAKDVRDLDLLFETARLDPELLLRNEAIRAIRAIARSDEGKRRAGEIALRLRDLYTSGDDGVREDVGVAWALAPLFANGGRAALRTLIAEGRGTGAIAAAGVVLRTVHEDAELLGSATALVARTIAEASRHDRLHAIAIAPITPALVAALRTASHDDDLDVRVSAFAQLLESAPDRNAAVAALEPIAGDKDERRRPNVERARMALASAGHVRIQAWIEEDLRAKDPQRRVFAAMALAALGRSARAAPLLADADPSVRTRTACTLVVAGR